MTSLLTPAGVAIKLEITDQTKSGKRSSKVEFEKSEPGKALIGSAWHGKFKLDRARHLVAQGSVLH